MFNIFKKDSETISIYSPVEGVSLSLEQVPDPIFSQAMLGDGVAFELKNQMIYAPVDGTVLMIAQTKHAMGLRLKNGAELMIHMGLDTVNFNGKGFDIFVHQGEKIKRGQLLAKVDLDYFREKNVNMLTPLICTSKEYIVQDIYFGYVNKSTKVFRIRKNR